MRQRHRNKLPAGKIGSDQVRMSLLFGTRSSFRHRSGSCPYLYLDTAAHRVIMHMPTTTKHVLQDLYDIFNFLLILG